MYKTIEVAIESNMATVWLNRPELHNAMNDVMIAELTKAFDELSGETSLRLILLRGKGKSFCAGADLHYMKQIAQYGYEENVADSKKLATVFQTIYACAVPTIAIVHGAAYGGANGLLAACDIVLAEEQTIFAFSEVKLGIAPATIGPYVMKRIGEFGAKELMITGKRFDGKEAEKWHLVNHSVPQAEMEDTLSKLIKSILSSGPLAVRATKKLIEDIVEPANRTLPLMDYTAQCIAGLRASEEGQEGMTAFLEKRKATWVD